MLLRVSDLLLGTVSQISSALLQGPQSYTVRFLQLFFDIRTGSIHDFYTLIFVFVLGLVITYAIFIVPLGLKYNNFYFKIIVFSRNP